MAECILKYKINSAQQTRAQICAKIAQLDLIIESLYNTALVSVDDGNISEYEIDTGQTKQKVKYTSTASVINSIEKYERMRQLLQNKLTSRTFRLMDSRNFKR